ncbi:acylglycerol kinase family protein, partial [Roseburia faecis]|nr:acylglycerol kinase family protein [Roseburia faecis]
WQQLQSRLNELNIVYQVVETRYHGHAVDLAERIAHRFASAAATHVVMVVGGDGTLHETLNGLIKANSSLPLAYIPAGSG